MFNTAAMAQASVYEPETITHFNRVTTKTGILLGAVNAVIKGMKDNNIWNKVDQIALKHLSEADSLLNIKGVSVPDLTKVGNIAYDGAKGFFIPVGESVNSGLNSGIKLGAVGINAKPNNFTSVIHVPEVLVGFSTPLMGVYGSQVNASLSSDNPSETQDPSKPETVTNGSFPSLSGWTIVKGHASDVVTSTGSALRVTLANTGSQHKSYVYQGMSTIVGALYTMKITGVSEIAGSSGELVVNVGTSIDSDDLYGLVSPSADSKTLRFRATTTTTYISIGLQGGDIEICTWDVSDASNKIGYTGRTSLSDSPVEQKDIIVNASDVSSNGFYSQSYNATTIEHEFNESSSSYAEIDPGAGVETIDWAYNAVNVGVYINGFHYSASHVIGQYLTSGERTILRSLIDDYLTTLGVI